MTSLKLLSGGAAQGLVAAVTPRFTSQTGWSIDGEFGAVGTMAAKLRGGAAVDVMILDRGADRRTRARGIGARRVRRRPLARWKRRSPCARATRRRGLPMRMPCAKRCSQQTRSSCPISSPRRREFTSRRFLPSSTSLIRSRPRLKIFPNGATAMRELAKSNAARPIGCTQVTEIVVTPGLRLVAPLPPACALATVYSARGDGARDGCVGGAKR